MRQLCFSYGVDQGTVDVPVEPVASTRLLSGSTIRFGRPRVLFSGEYDSAVGHQHYDISLDSERFLMIKHGEPDGPHEVRVVLNWDEELRRR